MGASTRLATLLRGALLSICLVSPGPIQAADATTGKTAKVTYLAVSSVYVDAGTEDGLRAGDRVAVVRNGVEITALLVTYVSSHRAACAMPEGSPELMVGDVVRFSPHPPEAPAIVVPTASIATAAASPATGQATHRPRNRMREAGLRGRVGARYQIVRDLDPGGETFSSPSLDLRLDGVNVGGSPMDLSVDVRARRTYQTHEGSSTDQDDQTRVYRLAAAWHDSASRYRVTVGRQYSPSLATVNIFDGLLLDFNSARWSTGLFTGTQPDPIDFGLSSDIREHGAFVQAHNLPQASRHWSLTSGLIGSYEQGEINREFLFVQGIYGDPKLTLFTSEEVDYNRGWKTDMGESQFSPTSTFVSVRYRFVPRWDVHAGYDNRRNVRLHRDLVTPETDFDDTYREGEWVGTSLDMGKHFATSLDVRSSSGGTSGRADSQTVTCRLHGLTRSQMEFRSRSTRYINDQLEGWLHSLGGGLTVGSRYHVELTGGVRDESGTADTLLDNRLTWFSLDQDVQLGRRWYLLLSAERDRGETASSDQIYASLTYRF